MATSPASRQGSPTSTHLRLSISSAGNSLNHSPSSSHRRRHHRHTSSMSLMSPSHSHTQALLTFFAAYLDKVPARVQSSLSLPLTLAQLTDGRVLESMLAALSPEYITVNESDSDSDSGSNDRRVSTLVTNIELALSSTLDYDIDLSFLDTGAVDQCDDAAMSALLSLSLLCCIHSANKESVVERIMTLSDDTQVTLMAAINDIEAKLSNHRDSGVGDGGGNDNSPTSSPTLLPSSLSSMLSPSSLPLSLSSQRLTRPNSHNPYELEQLRAQIAVLTQQVQESKTETANLNKQLQKERELTQQVNDDVNVRVDLLVTNKLSEYEKLHTEKKRAETAKTVKDVTVLESQLHSLELEKQSLNDRLILVTRERDRLSSTTAEMTAELSTLKEEFSLAKQQLLDHAATKQQLQRLQQRFEALTDLKSQYAVLEEEYNDSKRTIELYESQLKSLELLKSQCQKYKETILSNESLVIEMKLGSESREAELTELREKLSFAKRENDSLTSELNELKQSVKANGTHSEDGSDGHHARMASASLSEFDSGGESLSQVHSAATSHANGASHHARGASLFEFELLRDELSLQKSLYQTTETKLLEAQRKIAQLESQLKSASSGGGTDRRSVEELHRELMAARDALSLQRVHYDSLIDGERGKYSELEKVSRALKEKHLQALTMLAEHQSDSEAHTLLIATMMEEQRDEERQWQREQRAMASAFYQFGMEAHRALLDAKVARMLTEDEKGEHR